MYDVIIFTENTNELQISIPLGGYKIASVLRKNGFSTLVVNHLSTFSTDEFKKLIDLIVTDKTKLIGFSTTFLQNLDSSSFLGIETVFPQGKEMEDEIVDYIKTKNSKVKLAAGGTKTSPMYFNTNIDYVFMGYSEVSIVNLMNHLTQGTDLPNSHVNMHNITIIDDRKAPTYNFTTDSMIWDKSDIINHKVLPFEIGRGCIFKCKFCSFPLNGKKKLDYIKEAELIYHELLENFINFGISHYLIVDDTFNDHILKLKAIESVIHKLPFQPKFWCYTRLDLLCSNPDMVDVMYNIGVRAMYFGIETLDITAGKLIGKGYDRKKQIEMVQYIRQKYPTMSMHGSFIAGLPGETLDSVRHTCSQLENGEIPLNSWMTRPFILFKNDAYTFNSDLDLNYKSYGYEVIGENGNMLLWKNEFTNIEQAFEVTNECNRISKTKDYFYLPGHDSFELINFGYDFEEVSQVPYKNFRWDIVQDHDVPNFIAEYKQQLFQTFLKER